MRVRREAASPASRQMSGARDLLIGAWRRIFWFADRGLLPALAVFLGAALMCVLSMFLFSWLSDVFHDAGVPFLGGLMTLMFWLMGIAGVLLILFGKFWILFRG